VARALQATKWMIPRNFTQVFPICLRHFTQPVPALPRGPHPDMPLSGIFCLEIASTVCTFSTFSPTKGFRGETDGGSSRKGASIAATARQVLSTGGTCLSGSNDGVFLMSLFDWKDEYAIGSPEIDREHRALFRMVSELEDAMVAGKAEGGLESLMERLVAYSRFHFQTEEKQMRAHGYPDTEQHVREHNEFTARLAELEKKLSQGEEETDFEALRFLAHWLEAHVLGADRRLARYVSAVTTNG